MAFKFKIYKAFRHKIYKPWHMVNTQWMVINMYLHIVPYMSCNASIIYKKHILKSLFHIFFFYY